MDVYIQLLGEIDAAGEAADSLMKAGNTGPEFMAATTTYHSLADFYKALTGIEVRPDA